jgi:hypothetical protein
MTEQNDRSNSPGPDLAGYEHLAKRDQRRVEVLRRRADYIDGRLKKAEQSGDNRTLASMSRDAAELSALRWALSYIATHK